MLSLLPFTNWDILFGNPRLLNQQQGVIKIICPSPQSADSVRLELAGRNSTSYSVVTISKFINDLVGLHPGTDKDIRVLRKSELMFELGALFKKQFLHAKNLKNDLNFERLFKVFTEIRGVTTESGLIDEFLETLDKDEAKTLFYFFEYIKMMKFHDEHEVYLDLAKSVQDVESNNDTLFIFHGFKHLSGQQIDFLKSFGIKHNCTVTAPEYFLKSATNQDWTSWIGFSNKVQITTKEETEKQTVKIIYYNRGDLAGAIKRFTLKQTDYFKHVLLATSKPEFEEIASLPIKNLSFKTSIDIFEGAKAYWDLQLKRMAPDPFKEIILEDILLELETSSAKAVKDKNYIMIKLLQSWKSNLVEWGAFGEQFKRLEEFDFTVIRNKVELDLPRVNSLILGNNENKVVVDSLSTASMLNVDNIAIIGASDTFAVASDLHDLANAWELLSAVGPLHSKIFEINDRQEKLLGALKNKGSILFLEKGLEEHDAGWSDFLLKIKKDIILLEDPSRENIHDPLTSYVELQRNVKRYSPSSLQHYWDCPRKYLYTIARPIRPQSSNLGEVSFAQQGDVEHQLIREYFELGRAINQNVDLLLRPHTQSPFRIFNEIELEKMRHEILEHATNGIELVKKISSLFPDCKLFFEHLYQDDHFYGLADLVIQAGDELVGIFDFKRSESSIPSDAKFLSYDKLQLWFYIKRDHRTPRLLGYLNLKNPEKSSLFTSEQISFTHLDIGVQGPEQKSAKIVFIENFEESMTGYGVLENKLVNCIESDKEFMANPRNENACTYCQLNSVCKKGIE